MGKALITKAVLVKNTPGDLLVEMAEQQMWLNWIHITSNATKHAIGPKLAYLLEISKHVLGMSFRCEVTLSSEEEHSRRKCR